MRTRPVQIHDYCTGDTRTRRFTKYVFGTGYSTGRRPWYHATEAITKLWKERGYDPNHPAQIKARLGYALDRIEAVAFVVTASLHLPLLSIDEAQTIGVRIHSMLVPSGWNGKKLAEAKSQEAR